MARSLAPRCVTTSGLDVLAIVSLSRPCTTGRGVVSISVYPLASQHGKGNSAQPCLLILASPGDHREAMKEESPRVDLNNLRCTLLGLFATQALKQSKLQATGHYSVWMHVDSGEDIAILVIVSSQKYNL